MALGAFVLMVQSLWIQTKQFSKSIPLQEIDFLNQLQKNWSL